MREASEAAGQAISVIRRVSGLIVAIHRTSLTEAALVRPRLTVAGDRTTIMTTITSKEAVA
jgi:hypothetical protein